MTQNDKSKVHQRHLARGTRHLLQGHSELGLDELAQGLEQAKKDGIPEFLAGYLSVRGVEYFRQGKYSEAIGEFEGLLEIDPGSTFALNFLGLIYRQSGDLRRAEEYFEQAASHGDSHAYYDLIQLYRRLGQRERARSTADRCLQESPDWPLCHFSLWNLLLEENDPSLDVDNVIKYCLAKQKYSFKAFLTLGLAYAAKGEKETAVRYLRSYKESAEAHLAANPEAYDEELPLALECLKRLGAE